MAINKETHDIQQVIMLKDIKKKLEVIAKKNKRSASAQALLYIEKGMEEDKEG